MQPPACFRSSPARAATTWAVSLLWLACCSSGGDLTAPETGNLVVKTATSGVPADTGGYVVAADGGVPRPIGANAADTFAALSAGAHMVQLSGVPQSCTLAGDNPRTVTVPAGGSVELAFEIACPPPPGAVTVVTATGGSTPDPDGYTLQVDGGAELAMGVNATLMLSELSTGQHVLLLGGVAPACTVAGDNPRTIDVSPGTTLTVEFTVTCVVGTLHWTEMTSGTRADLPEVWGTAAANVFVVGEQETTDGGGVASVILRYDGSAWTQQLRQTDLRLRGVWGSSASDVFAVGFHFFTSGAVVLHYDGNQWSQVQNFLAQFEELAFTAIWGSSATDVFAVGSAFDGEFARTLIVHYDGSAWHRMETPPAPAPGLADVWGSSARNVYAIGFDRTSDPSTGVILHYDGAVWSPVLQEESLLLNGIWGSSASDVFAVGFEVSPEFQVTGAIRHFDGNTWSRVPIPAVGVLYEVWGSSPTDVYAAADEGHLLHYDGTAWAESRPSRRTLLGVWGSSPADVFLVGNRGTILHGTP
jgi:hypothetical protein